MPPELTAAPKPAPGEFHKLLARWRLSASLHPLLTAIVAIALIATPLYAGWRYLRTLRQLLYRMSNEIVDLNTGLKAVARDSERSRAQLSTMAEFLAGKFPEFEAVFKIQEAQEAADNGDFSEMDELLKKARALFSDAQDRKLNAPPDIFAAAIESLNEIEKKTPEAMMAAGPVINDLRVLLANYRSTLEPARILMLLFAANRYERPPRSLTWQSGVATQRSLIRGRRKNSRYWCPMSGLSSPRCSRSTGSDGRMLRSWIPASNILAAPWS